MVGLLCLSGARCFDDQVTIAEEHIVTATTQHAMVLISQSGEGKPANGHTAVCASVAGNVHDLYREEDGAGAFLPLTDLLARSWDLPGRIVLTYEAEAENISQEDIIHKILNTVEVP